MNESGLIDQRREFLRCSLRSVVLAGISALTAGLLWRGRHETDFALEILPVACRGCAELGRCQANVENCVLKHGEGSRHGRR
jgi:hypothetical protein